MGYALIGELVGAVLSELGDLTRAAIAASLRDVADKVERGDVVSDESIDALKQSTSKIRDLLDRAGQTGD